MVSPPAAARPWVRFDRPSPFGRVVVVDEGELRYLRFGGVDGDDQSVVSLTDPGAAPMEYIRHALLGALMTTKHRRALLIGLGGGSFASLLLRAYPRLTVEAVEVNPVVVEAARRFFGVKEGPRLEVHVADGAAFVGQRAGRGTYDLVMLDAYGEEEEPPAQLATPELYRAVRSLLAGGGVAVVNLSVSSRVARVLIRRLCTAFSGGCSSIPGQQDANEVIFCGAGGPPPERGELARRAGRVSGLSFDLGPLVGRLLRDCCGHPEGAPAARSAKAHQHRGASAVGDQL